MNAFSALAARLEDLIATPQGLIIAVLAGFIALTLLITLFGFFLVRLLRRKPRIAEAASAADPLLAPRARRSNAPIGLARLREEALPEETTPAAPNAAPTQAPSEAVPSMQAAGQSSALSLMEARSAKLSAAWQAASLLPTLPFAMRPGLETAHADICGIGVEAVFFDPDVARLIEDDALRLAPFLPAGAAQVLLTEADRETLRTDSLFAQPDAVMTLSGGLLVLEYKSKGGRPEDRERWTEEMREKDLLQTIINALAASAHWGRPAAPVLRTHDAVFFLRPSPAVTALIKESAEHASVFLSSALAACADGCEGAPARPGIAAADLAALLAVPLVKRFPKRPTASHRQGEVLHATLLSRRQ